MSKKINSTFKQILSLVRQSISKKKSYELHNPYFSKDEITLLNDCVKSSYVATSGKYIDLFEKKLKKITKSKDVVTVLNGTVALKICLKILGIQNGDEVLVPSLTFVGTVNAIKHAGGTPHFIDTDINTLGIDNNKLKKYIKQISQKNSKGYYINKKTKKKIFAVIPVHVFGNVGKIDELCKIANSFNLKIIEDAAEGLNSFYKKKHVGNFGDLGILSFNANKIITTGGGGAIICGSTKMGKKIRHLTSTAKIKHKWEFLHDEIGWNYRMNNLSSALGCAQLNKFSKIKKFKNNLSNKYLKNSKKFKNINFLKEPKFCKSNKWMNVILVDGLSLGERNKILGLLHKKGVKCRPIWKLIHKLKMYKKSPRSDLSNAKKLETRIFCLPSGAEYGHD